MGTIKRHDEIAKHNKNIFFLSTIYIPHNHNLLIHLLYSVYWMCDSKHRCDEVNDEKKEHEGNEKFVYFSISVDYAESNKKPMLDAALLKAKRFYVDCNMIQPLKSKSTRDARLSDERYFRVSLDSSPSRKLNYHF